MNEHATCLVATPTNVSKKLPLRLWLGAILAFVVAPLTSNFAIMGRVLVADAAILLAICLLLLRFNILSMRIKIGLFKQLPQLRWIVVLALLGTVSAGFALGSSYGSTDVFARLRIVALLTLSFAVLFRASNPRFADRVLRIYLGMALLACVVVIIQVIWFKVFGGILAPNLSAIEVEPNAIFHVNSSGEFRTGGLFREPSWFIVFVAPASFWFLRFGSKVKSMIVTIGLLLSTSSLGLLVLLVLVVETYVVRGKKKIRNLVILTVLIVFGAFAVSRIVPASKERAIANLSGEGTITIRLFAPVLVVSNHMNWSLLGVNTSWIRGVDGNSEEDWLNSAVYAVVLLGIPWAILFFVTLFKIAGPTGGIILFVLILFEGCIGRADFWAAFAVFGVMRLIASRGASYGDARLRREGSRTISPMIPV
jgi:hypothetical protein